MTNIMLIHTLQGFFSRNWQTISRIHVGMEMAKMAKAILNKNKVEGLTLLAIEMYSETIVILDRKPVQG